MADSLANSIDSLDINEDTSLDLPLVLSALESLDEQNAVDLAEELSALAAIYDGDQGPALKLYRPPPTARRPSPPPTWTPSSPDPLRLLLSTTLDEETPIHLLLSIPYPSYPTSEPPLIQLHDRYLGKFQVTDELFGEVLRTFMHDNEAGVTSGGVEWSGGVCLFEGIESVKELCSNWIKEQEEEKQRGEELRQEASGHAGENVSDESQSQRRGGEERDKDVEEGGLREPSFAKMRRKPIEDDVPCPDIYSTEGLVDRKSLFVAHAARVHSMAEVEAVMSALLSNNKIAKATHNISAYQFISSDGIRHSDNDDDGEKAAGSTLASLLERIDVQNIVVVVSRWYGGIHLGPDRFKDINQAARDALVEGGFFGETNEKPKSKTGRNGTKR
ncbi:IMPACT family protein [Sporobolomyces salmoneus]|uniref:IMPACT family protein n=1 Tax=Sporobolomyces salmoneus TaxID=183962 RepID=UPI0031746711